MRKTVILLATAALALGLFTPTAASAKSKRYSISVSVSVYTHADRKITKMKVIDVSRDHEKDKVRLTGKVKRGPVKGQRVRVYAVNTDDSRKKRNLGTVKLSRGGKFVVWHHPPRGGRWRYEIVKASSGRYKGTTKRVHVDAFHWTYLHELADVRSMRLTGDRREYVGPRTRADRLGTRWTEELVFGGSSAVTFPTAAYRCKKISLKAGISNNTEDNVVSGTMSFLGGSTVLKRLTMSKGQAPFDNAGNDSASKRFRDSLKPNRNLTVQVAAPVFAPVDPDAGSTVTNDLTDLRFILGNAKVFCTFPSVNLDI